MRALKKGAEPVVLVKNRTAWAAAYLASSGKTRPWAHADIKEALLAETNAKCAYCEARMLAVDYGDVEHILPKTVFPELVVDWKNLTLACSRCNQGKGSKHDPMLPFINPYEDAIEEHLLFFGQAVYATSDRGAYTVRELGLNDPSRIEARDRAIKRIEDSVLRFEAADSDYVRESLRELIGLQLVSGEYTATLILYITLRKSDLLV